MTPVICHHCGRDFAREYWDSEPSLEHPDRRMIEARVCPNCCRDLNPNCGPSAWTPPSREAIAQFQCLYTVAKRCYECGAEWEGKAFTAQPANALRLPGLCAECIAKDEARIAALTRRVVEVTPKDMELEPPRPVREMDEDQGYPTRPRLVREIE